MPNQHKNPTIGWNSADSTLKPWIEAEAERRGITRRELLDEMAAEYREKAEFVKTVEARTANAEISAALNTETTEKGEPR